jgi:hypothetical protein
MLKTMFYIKNVPVWERVLRITIGLGLVLYVLLGQPAMFISGLSLFSAAFVVLTGFFGWCPMCALVGRKIKS